MNRFSVFPMTHPVCRRAIGNEQVEGAILRSITPAKEIRRRLGAWVLQGFQHQRSPRPFARRRSQGADPVQNGGRYPPVIQADP